LPVHGGAVSTRIDKRTDLLTGRQVVVRRNADGQTFWNGVGGGRVGFWAEVRNGLSIYRGTCWLRVGPFDRRTDLFASAKTQDENDESHKGTDLLGSVASFVKNLRRKRRIAQKDRPSGTESGGGASAFGLRSEMVCPFIAAPAGCGWGLLTEGQTFSPRRKPRRKTTNRTKRQTFWGSSRLSSRTCEVRNGLSIYRGTCWLRGGPFDRRTDLFASAKVRNGLSIYRGTCWLRCTEGQIFWNGVGGGRVGFWAEVRNGLSIYRGTCWLRGGAF
jgi:hypothetical protein